MNAGDVQAGLGYLADLIGNPTTARAIALFLACVAWVALAVVDAAVRQMAAD